MTEVGFCTSIKCIGHHENSTCFRPVEKMVKKGSYTCPDCGYALKIGASRDKIRSKGRKMFNPEKSEYFK